jgi:DNA-binding transcriptional LysR family regulator
MKTPRLTRRNRSTARQSQTDGARSGLGLAVADVSNRTAQPSLNDGSLVTALHDRRQRIPGLFLYHAGRRHVPPAPQALIEFIQEYE